MKIILVPDKYYDKFRKSFLSYADFTQYGRCSGGLHVFTANLSSSALKRLRMDVNVLYPHSGILIGEAE